MKAIKEIWKNINGYEDRYQVSNFGRVKSKPFVRGNHTGTYVTEEKIMKLQKNKKGYLRVSLYKNYKAKMFSVHRLVAEAFLINEMKYKEVNHKDFDKTNNKVSNLEWCSRIYNLNYGDTQLRNRKSKNYDVIAKKHRKIIIGIHYDLQKEFCSISEAAEYLNVSISAISKALHGKIKKVKNWEFCFK